MTTQRYVFLTLLHTPHIESLLDLSVRVPTGTPPSEFTQWADPGRVQRGAEGGSTQRILEIVWFHTKNSAD